MLRTTTAILALALLAGCIAVPEDPDALAPANLPPEDDRIDGMTGEATITDADVECDDNDGISVRLPRFCAERLVEVHGRIGLETLLVDLEGTNGDIRLVPSEGDAWSFTATVRTSGLTPDMARAALDDAWTWSHEEPDGSHALRAGPPPREGVDVLTDDLVSTIYEVELPSWILLDLDLQTENGQIEVDALTRDADLATDNGQIVVTGEIGSLHAETSNGQIVAVVRPITDGSIDLATENGQIVLKVPEDRDHGYDLDAQTENGMVLLSLRECAPAHDDDRNDWQAGPGTSARCTTRGYDARDVQTTVDVRTQNAQVIIGTL